MSDFDHDKNESHKPQIKISITASWIKIGSEFS